MHHTIVTHLATHPFSPHLTLFTHLTLILRYHESVKDTNLNASLWEENPTALSFGREIKFFKPVNLPGLASTRGVKIQKYRKFGDYGLLLWSSTRLEDVPAADTFSVDDLLAVCVFLGT